MYLPISINTTIAQQISVLTEFDETQAHSCGWETGWMVLTDKSGWCCLFHSYFCFIPILLTLATKVVPHPTQAVQIQEQFFIDLNQDPHNGQYPEVCTTEFKEKHETIFFDENLPLPDRDIPHTHHSLSDFDFNPALLKNLEDLIPEPNDPEAVYIPTPKHFTGIKRIRDLQLQDEQIQTEKALKK